MTFGQKLFQLRKKNGFSQESLAERLGTTRQAISKWENNQGFPETEKLLQLSNIFGVSTDFLLKDETTGSSTEKNGYYVSRETAAGYLANQKKVNLYLGIGFMFLSLTGIPFVLFPFNPAKRLLGMAVLAGIAVAAFAAGAVLEQTQYKPLKEEPLVFEPGYLKDLTDEFYIKKKLYHAVFIPSTVLFIMGITAIALTLRGAFPWSVYHAFVFLGFAIGILGFCYSAGVMEAYELLIENEEHTKGVFFKAKRKIKDIFSRL